MGNGTGFISTLPASTIQLRLTYFYKGVTMKKLTKLLLPGIIACTLIACGDKSKNSEPASTASAASTQETTLNVWAMGEEAKSLDTLVAGFEQQNPTIHVKVQSIPWGMVHQKLLTALSGDSTPDVSMMGTSFMAEFVKLNAFEDLTPYLAKDSSVKLSDFIPSTLLTTQFDGKTYGFPWYADTRIMFYRKDLMNQAGFKEFPKTWDEMFKLAEAEKKNGVKAPITLIKNDTNTPTEMLVTLWQNQTNIVDDNGKSMVATPAFKQAVSYYTSYFKNGLAPMDLGGDVAPLFVNGKLGMFVGGPWMISLVNKAGGKDFADKWGVAVMPTEKTNTSFLGGANFVMFKNSKNKADAYKLMEYLASAPAQKQFYDLTSNLPTVQNAWTGIESNPTVAVFKRQLNNVNIPYNIPQGPRLYKVFGDTVEQIIYGKVTIDAGIAELDKQVTQIMQK